MHRTGVTCEKCTPLLLEVVAHEAEAPVGVVLLRVQPPIVHDVLEGVVHEPTPAARILALQRNRVSRKFCITSGTVAINGNSCKWPNCCCWVL